MADADMAIQTTSDIPTTSTNGRTKRRRSSGGDDDSAVQTPVSESEKKSGKKGRKERRARKRAEADADDNVPDEAEKVDQADNDKVEATESEGKKKRRKKSKNKAKESAEGFQDDDFIAFVMSDDEKEALGHQKERERGDDRDARDKERDRSADTERRDRNRDRDRHREHDSRDKDRDRDRHRDRDRDRDGERDRDRHRDKGKERERDRDGGRDRERRDRGGDRDRDRDRDRGERNSKRKYDDYDDGYENKKQRLDAQSRRCPWIDGLDFERCRNVAEMMNLEVESFVDWISPTPVEDEIRSLIVTQITRTITNTFRDAQVHPFGSYQTKLYLPLGDIDLVVLSDSMAYSDKTTVLYALANALKRAGITSHVTIIAKAKVPIVKFVTTHGRFRVDISINQPNGLISGQIISGFLNDMIPSSSSSIRSSSPGQSKALRGLVLITKAFLSQRSMNEVYTGGLGSYAIVCLAVSFLQMHPKIRNGEIDPERNLGVLIVEFFELYGNLFNYEEVGISVRGGGLYFNKRQRGWYDVAKRSLLSIEDPVDPSNDISSGSYNFHKVRTAFAGAYGILTSTAYNRAGILNSRRSGSSFKLRDSYASEDLSVLSTVMGITQETINHRKLVQELYDRRTLHRLVGVAPRPAVGIEDRVDEHDEKKRSGVVGIKLAVEDEENDSEKGDAKLARQAENEREEAGGRYSIQSSREPSKKRRKLKLEERITQFVEDDDASSSEDDERSRRRRDYWLSKGIGVVDDDYSD